MAVPFYILVSSEWTFLLQHILLQFVLSVFQILTILMGVSEKAMAPCSSTLAWEIPWTEEPGRLQSMGSRRVGHDWATLLFTFHFHALEKEMATHSSVLAWRIPGTGEPGGLPSMGSHRVGHDWRDSSSSNSSSNGCVVVSRCFNLHFPYDI